MKKLYFLFSFAMLSFLANAQEPFITTWEVDNDDLIINAPIFNDFNNNNYTIDFGDGTILTNQLSPASHTYTNPGIYTITISGDYFQIEISDYDKSQLLTVEQWGDAQWTTMQRAFENCYYLTITATDAPDLSQATNMSYMFKNCSSMNQSINDWDVSNITHMNELFCYATSFNQPLNNWDLSNVTSMKGMFKEASAFNQPLDNWDVHNVTNMQELFDSAIAFNQSLNNWDVSSVTNMSVMFKGTEAFNQPLDNWDVSSVINMTEMFNITIAFNQNINSWNVSAVKNMRAMFLSSAFNQPLDNWDVSSVTNMSLMFGTCYFNQPINSWDVSSVTTMQSMFIGNIAFNQPLNNWDVSNVEIGMFMFAGAINFNQPLNNWDISNMNIQGMFSGASSFNQDLSDWEFNSWSYLQLLDNCGMDSNNYDALLNKLAELQIENKFLEADNVQYCDSNIHDYLINNLNWTIEGDSLNETCDLNSIHGTIRYDEDSNGCDTEDSLINSFLVNAVGEEYNFSSIPINGEYNIKVTEGTYTVNLMNVPSYYTVTPTASDIEFTGAGNGETLNFCLSANETVSDLNITVLAIDEARPGFQSHYQLVAENIGTQTINEITLNFTFDDTKQSFVLASQTPESIVQNQLAFDLDTMLPFERKLIYITMQTFSPPTVNGDDIINFVSTITPDTNDYTPTNNTYTLEQLVVNSYDPNDKRVMQGEEIYIEDTDRYLDYVIRFQNTGTASAVTVRIEDVLHENLDWSTFTPLTASHDYIVTITDENKVEFIFNNINLPHEEADEAGSHGFVAYKIKPVQDIQIGDMITGTAGIYFDYNLPIITNSADTEVVELLGVNDFAVKTIAVYPNPAKNIINIKPQGEVLIEGIKIYNLQGREIISLNGTHQTVDIQNLSNGVYFLSIETDKGLSRHKLIKN